MSVLAWVSKQTYGKALDLKKFQMSSDENVNALTLIDKLSRR